MPAVSLQFGCVCVCVCVGLRYSCSLPPFVSTVCLAPAQALILIYLHMLPPPHTHTHTHTRTRTHTHSHTHAHTGHPGVQISWVIWVKGNQQEAGAASVRLNAFTASLFVLLLPGIQDEPCSSYQRRDHRGRGCVCGLTWSRAAPLPPEVHTPPSPPARRTPPPRPRGTGAPVCCERGGPRGRRSPRRLWSRRPTRTSRSLGSPWGGRRTGRSAAGPSVCTGWGVKKEGREIDGGTTNGY